MANQTSICKEKKKKAQTDSFGIQTDYKNLETHK